MRNLTLAAFAFAFGALAGAGAQAEPSPYGQRVQAQQPARFAKLNETIVRKRSFLDAGVVVPVGSMSRYMDDATVFNWIQPGGTYRQPNFGAQILPGPLDIPGFMPVSR
jgi:hypothetical protein